jgi:teichoic acid transport system ATP-binding protein
MKPKVVFENVSKTYTLYEGKFEKLIDLVTTKRKKNKTFYALRNISFEVYAGETIGIIGVNGSGKSTLSNLLAQVIPPTSGNISIDGETSLIAISAGLNNNLTGIENIELKCLMHGLSSETIKEITPKIIEFADIGDFIRQPVKNYSSGMKSRLGFAISVHTDPDILIIDEALSVGDETFYEKCLAKMDEFKKQGKTIFFISHSISQVRSFCDRIIWLHHGEVESLGKIGQVIREYKEYIAWHKGLSVEEQKKYKKEMMAKQLIPLGQTENVETNSENTHLRSAKKKKTPEKKGKNVILTALFLCFIISAFMLLNDGLHSDAVAPKGIEKNEKQLAVKKPAHSVSSPKTIRSVNKEGYVVENQIQIFKESEKKNIETSLDFSKKIMVLGEIDQLYKIRLEDGSEGFTDKKYISLEDSHREINELKMSEIIPMTPDAFRKTYQFYLAYLNVKEEKIKNDLRGLKQEIERDSNEKFLVFGNGKVLYRINNGVSTAVIVKDIDTNSQEFSQLSKNAMLQDHDGNVGLVVTEKNNLIYNKTDDSLTIEAK